MKKIVNNLIFRFFLQDLATSATRLQISYSINKSNFWIQQANFLLLNSAQ